MLSHNKCFLRLECIPRKEQWNGSLITVKKELIHFLPYFCDKSIFAHGTYNKTTVIYHPHYAEGEFSIQISCAASFDPALGKYSHLYFWQISIASSGTLRLGFLQPCLQGYPSLHHCGWHAIHLPHIFEQYACAKTLVLTLTLHFVHVIGIAQVQPQIYRADTGEAITSPKAANVELVWPRHIFS